MRSAVAILACVAVPVCGELADVDEGGFVSAPAIEIDAPPAIFEALTDEIDVETGSPVAVEGAEDAP